MPDGDVIPSRPVLFWKRAHDLICSMADEATVADSLKYSLLRSIKTKGGLPFADTLADVVEQYAHGNVTITAALGELRSIERMSKGHLHTRLASRAAAVVLVDVSHGATLIAPPLRVVLEGFCEQLIRNHLLGRSGPALQNVQFTTYEARVAWEQGHLQALRPFISEVADSLESDPTGKHLDVACSPEPLHPTTSTILEINLLGDHDFALE